VKPDRGQAMVEFALVSTLLIVFVLGIIDFSYLFAGRLVAYEATRNAARYAATHPVAWSNANPAPVNSIEGHLVVTSAPAKITNDDAHVKIYYYIPGAGTLTKCGQYTALTGLFTASGTYTQATCVIPGTFIQITSTYTYTFITPMLKATWTNLTITTTAGAMEEV
jgi:Flp pilus assembly protein TadG